VLSKYFFVQWLEVIGITQRQKTEGAIKNRAIEQHSAQDTERRQSAQKHNAAHKPKIMTRIPPNNRGCLLRVNSSCMHKYELVYRYEIPISQTAMNIFPST
jgi:hypothetical protein